MRWAHLWAALLLLVGAKASTLYQAAGVTRHHEGDTFLLRREGTTVACSRTLCADSHALPTSPESAQCGCRCPPELPVFREDLHVCVDELHECAMATFKNGAKYQKVPFVFLPMKGQIIHPSSDIIFTEGGEEEPVCVVSSAQFLTRSGWLELRNSSDMEPPLRLFRDHRRTFLQWLGEQDLRLSMEGRVLLARLMCKDATGFAATTSHSGVITHAFSTPCVAFRVAGSQGAREVMFTPDYTVAGSRGLLHGLLGVGTTEQRPSSGLSTSEGVAVGLCVLLLGLVYAASVCVYLHVRRRRRRRKKRRMEDSSIASSDTERGVGGHHHRSGHHEMGLLGEGVVKSNPLLLGSSTYSVRGPAPQGPRRSLRSTTSETQGQAEDEHETSASTISDNSGRSTEEHTTLATNASTKALVHPERHKLGPAPPIPLTNNFAASMADAAMTSQSSGSGHYTLTLQPAAEGGSMERHPEESVSIVETLEEEPNSPFARSRDFSFLGGRHSMCAASLGLPGATGEGSSRNCSSSTSGSANSSPFLTGPGTGTRRKLYFNPAYFEPEMLHAPPPAALEFLQKLREVITMSKHKMAAKRFSPSLLGIPEERDSVKSEQSAEKRSWAGSHSRRSDTVSVLPDTDDVNGSKQQTIRRWLEDLESGDPVEDVEPEVEESKPESIIPAAPPPPPPLPVVPAPPSKKLMDAVIKELVRERGLTPADTTSDDTNLSSEKPAEQAIMEDNDYEMITLQATESPSPQPPSSSAPSSPVARPPLMMYCLPELLAKTNGYNLVSEVYVNDGYSSNQSSVSRSSIKKKQNQRQRPLQGSAGSSEHSSPSSLSESPEDSGPNFAGRLTIQVAESTALHYRGGYESEEFEPDTLDRGKRHQQQISSKRIDDCTDSLERPTKIMLKTSGSFFKDAEHANKTSWVHSNDIWKCPKEKKKRSPSSIADLRSTNIVTVLPGLQRNKEFGSLREIFEAKRQQQLQKQIQELEHMWMPQVHDYVKRGATRSLVEPNELRWRSGLSQQMVDEIRELMWKSTPETGVPLPRVPPTKPKRQRSADVTASPPTPPPSVPPSLPPTLPPKQRKQNQHPSTPPREIKPPPSLPPKNARGSRSPHSPPLARASAASDEDDDEMQGGSCTLGRKVEQGLSDAFSTWKRQRQGWEPEVRITHRPGDSGYLSSDSSNNSLKRDAKEESSETEESLCESESGAESIGTDSFFFGRVRPQESVSATPRQPAGRYEMAPGTTVVHMPPVPVKKRPPPPPKRVNSRLETKVLPTRNENIVRNLSSQYAL